MASSRFSDRQRLLVGGAVAALLVPLLLAACELALRAVGLPTGVLAMMEGGEHGLYPRGFSGVLDWGPIPYRVEANSLGLRGPELAIEKRPGVRRVVTVGDSVTDGFFVDNGSTYPAQLQSMLDAGTSGRVEVVSVARGGGSIDRELMLLTRVGLPLRPDVVVLTFVTNDIAEIARKSVHELLSYEPPNDRSWRTWLWVHTAIGESLFRARRALAASASPPAVTSADGRDRATYARQFLDRYGDRDGLVLRDEFSAATDRLLQNYVLVLAELARRCREAGAKLLFVYFPAYSQVYLDDAATRIAAVLGEQCDRLGIAFLDLTPVFRAHRAETLHFAPIDFHPNADGNRLIAEAVAGKIREDQFMAGR
jgi:lysophospholipase L1-like esterase